MAIWSLPFHVFCKNKPPPWQCFHCFSVFSCFLFQNSAVVFCLKVGGRSHFGSSRLGSRGPPRASGMEAAILTLGGVAVAGRTDGACVCIPIATWLRLGGEVALDRPTRQRPRLGAATAPLHPPGAGHVDADLHLGVCHSQTARHPPSVPRPPAGRVAARRG